MHKSSDKEGKWLDSMTVEGGHIRILISPSPGYQKLMSEMSRDADIAAQAKEQKLADYRAEVNPIDKIIKLGDLLGVR